MGKQNKKAKKPKVPKKKPVKKRVPKKAVKAPIPQIVLPPPQQVMYGRPTIQTEIKPNTAENELILIKAKEQTKVQDQLKKDQETALEKVKQDQESALAKVQRDLSTDRNNSTRQLIALSGRHLASDELYTNQFNNINDGLEYQLHSHHLLTNQHNELANRIDNQLVLKDDSEQRFKQLAKQVLYQAVNDYGVWDDGNKPGRIEEPDDFVVNKVAGPQNESYHYNKDLPSVIDNLPKQNTHNPTFLNDTYSNILNESNSPSLNDDYSSISTFLTNDSRGKKTNYDDRKSVDPVEAEDVESVAETEKEVPKKSASKLFSPADDKLYNDNPTQLYLKLCKEMNIEPSKNYRTWVNKYVKGQCSSLARTRAKMEN